MPFLPFVFACVVLSVCIDLCGWPCVYVHICMLLLGVHTQLHYSWTWGHGSAAMPLPGYWIQQFLMSEADKLNKALELRSSVPLRPS